MVEDEEQNPDDKVFQAFIDKMKKFAEGYGLYMMDAHGTRKPLEERVLVGTDPVVKPFVYARFDIGDIAFSDRVQNPQKYTEENVMDGIVQATLNKEAERIMERFRDSGALFDNEDGVDE